MTKTSSPRPAAPARPGRRERRRTETRERLFRAALRLFAERGFSNTTVEDITEAADVGKGTFFNYFPSKEHVIAALAEMQLGKLQTVATAAKTSPEPMHRLLHRLTHVLAEEPGRSAALVRSILLAVLSSEPVREVMQRSLERARHVLAELMALGQRRGEIRRDREAIELARVFQQTFFGTLLMWAIDPQSPLTERFDAGFRLLWPGISAGSRKHRKEKTT